MPEVKEENTQSAFIRVLCNEQRNQNTLCYCENSAADKDNVTQCSACFTWYHTDCWGEHVDVQDGGPSKDFKKRYFRELHEQRLFSSSKPEIQPEQDQQIESDENGSEGGEDEQDEMEVDRINKSSVEKQDDFLLCDKCMDVNKLSRGALADVILGKKNIEHFLSSY